jgi:hypothetical protein
MTEISWLIVSYIKIHKSSLNHVVDMPLLQVKFAMKLDLAGTMVWSVDTDDFRGDCIKNSGGGSRNYPLMKTISRTISETLKERQEQEDQHQTTEHTTEQGQSAAPKFRAVLWVIVAHVAVQHSATV